ncbi:radical SAM protein [Actinomadura xylanilytica]|uniref:radical SAM protein n=1 Tax=Actinomadura xylanilytica TaxID=887459 RepID=UPI00255B0ECE|nr:radical SAM protein [Actinomadura xylanilytica]MDL4770704.1 radical SAM protein [Actinomadura xylanilytica]
MTTLGMPPIPARNTAEHTGPIRFTDGHHFTLSPDADLAALVDQATAPMSVILQITKRCDFDCNFCSETMQMRDPTLADLESAASNLAGVQRVFLSGGEPLLRRDLTDIVEIFTDGFIIGLPTNATRGVDVAPKLAGKIAFANIGFDGPRSTFQRVRGDYDKVMTGVNAFREAGIPISFSTVALRSVLHGLPYLLQIADVLDVGKLKLILPLRKGNALDLPENEFITVEEARDHFARLMELRTTHAWTPAVRMTPWTAETEGHMLVIEPNGVTRAWPVYNQPDLWMPLGNVFHEPITDIWQRYPYKENHVRKYLGDSIMTCARGDR